MSKLYRIDIFLSPERGIGQPNLLMLSHIRKCLEFEAQSIDEALQQAQDLANRLSQVSSHPHCQQSEQPELD
ncbi:MAG: hypothetical protein F6K36_01200 [Symploca sp. SIO3C6]|nr:hypothetical protein [Symploca sp. SIO3C6]NET06678.1 hypothetical protein [Symploca sp. SIO2B6]